MDCSLIADELIAYQFGTCSDSMRSEVESHLLGCADCLRAYLALKRELDTGAGTPRPSASLKERLRADVARTFVKPAARARWFDRRIPLYQTIAAAAVAAVVAAVLPNLVRELRPDSSIRGSAIIDTSRSVPRSSTIL